MEEENISHTIDSHQGSLSNQSPENEIIIYQPNSTLSLDVRVENDTVWLNRNQIALLFDRDVKTIGKHINNALKEELDGMSTIANFATVQIEGSRRVTRNIDYYNLDVILSVGYRVKSKRGIQFRQWANKVLKEYLLKGYSINQRLLYMESRIDHRLSEHDHQIKELSGKIDIFLKTSLPPREGVLFDGQIFDAYIFVCDLIRRAHKRIVLIDNYIDETVLTLLGKRVKGVTATIYTMRIDDKLRLDIKRYNGQYEPVKVSTARNVHDRFLIIDDTVYHIGASIKDLGKKLFAFSQMEISPSALLDNL